MVQKREHEYNPEHPNRPAWFPDITLGNVLAIITMLFSAAAVYAATESRLTKLETQVAAQEDVQEKQAVELKETTNKIESKLERLDGKIDQILMTVRRSS